MEVATNEFCQGVDDLLGGKLRLVLRCVMFGESNFNERERGKDNDLGLFQIVPKYHCRVYREDDCDYVWSKVENKLKAKGISCPKGTCDERLLNCPCYNIVCGVAMYCRYLKISKNDPCGGALRRQFKSIGTKKYACCICYYGD